MSIFLLPLKNFSHVYVISTISQKHKKLQKVQNAFELVKKENCNSSITLPPRSENIFSVSVKFNNEKIYYLQEMSPEICLSNILVKSENKVTNIAIINTNFEETILKTFILLADTPTTVNKHVFCR